MKKTGEKHRLRLLWLSFSQTFATYKSKASDRNPWTAAAMAPGYPLEHKDHGFSSIPAWQSSIHACLVSPKKSYMLLIFLQLGDARQTPDSQLSDSDGEEYNFTAGRGNRGNKKSDGTSRPESIKNTAICLYTLVFS